VTGTPTHNAGALKPTIAACGRHAKLERNAKFAAPQAHRRHDHFILRLSHALPSEIHQRISYPSLFALFEARWHGSCQTFSMEGPDEISN
jgi:hypothetical protein